MAGFLYLAVALLLQIWEKPEQLWRYFGIGAVLGIGYLAKSPVFPLALVLFAILWVLVGTWHRALPRVLIAVLVFAAIAGPLVLVISRIKGRLTFGDSARINYIVRLDGASPGWYFQNLGTAGALHVHCPQSFLIHLRCTNATPIGGTIPIWYDPSYWSDGATPRFPSGNW
jgi:4-amino-4-deoxy-L-arabinose transferase-like glycosyltransferase